MKHPMSQKLASFLCASIISSSVGLAEVTVKVEQLSPAKPVKVEDVWVVFKTHFDIGYTDMIADVLARYRGPMIDNALAVIEANQSLPPEQRFAWTIPGWPLHHILGPDQTPERRARIIKALKDGALAVHAAPFTLHTESFDPEDLVRGLHYSAQIARENGLPLPRSAKMTDVPEHAWITPTLFKHAGIDFFQVGCNGASDFPRFPMLFWWEGPDGSRLLTNYTRDYGSGIVPPPGWPARNYLAMIMTGDNHGPPNAAEVESIRKNAAAQLPGVRVHFGTLDDFLRAIEAETPDLPVVRGDTPDTWIHGLLSMPVESKIARNLRPLESALDSLDTHLKLYGLTTPLLAPALDKSYEQSLLFGEHTWGMSGTSPGGFRYGDDWKKALADGKYKKFLQAFDEKRGEIHRADEIVTRELRQRLNLLAGSVKATGQRIVVWNALPWPRSGMVEVAGKSLYATDVPANGYKTFPAELAICAMPVLNDPPTALNTPFYMATFDLKRGGIISLIEKKSGCELVDRASSYALGQFLHERFSANEVNNWMHSYPRFQDGWALNDFGKPGMPGPNASPYATFTPSDWKILVTRSASTDSATLTAGDTKGLGQVITLTFTFDRHSPAVECEWKVTNKTPNPIPAGGWLCFPFAVKEPRFTLGRPGGPIDPATDIIPGAGRYRFAVTTGVTIAGADKTGVSLCPIDSPLVSLDQPGLWKHSLDFVPKVPAVFVNLYNNMWNTNFPLWQDGSWSERVRLWPTTDLVIPSWEARVPLLAATADGPAGKLPLTQSGLTVSRPGVLVTAFGQNPDGLGMLLRVWDQTGVTGDLTVTLPGNFKTATPVNLRGENAGKPVRIRSGKLMFHLGACAPASFLLTDLPGAGGGEGNALRSMAADIELNTAPATEDRRWFTGNPEWPTASIAMNGTGSVKAGCWHARLGEEPA